MVFAQKTDNGKNTVHFLTLTYIQSAPQNSYTISLIQHEKVFSFASFSPRFAQFFHRRVLRRIKISPQMSAK